MSKYRVNVYIDGFNLYHAIDELGDPSLKWVDLWKLSENILNQYQELHEVKYFSAYATWRPDSYMRHRQYVAVLESMGVQAVMGRFKEKQVVCKAACGEVFRTHEEKETDVNIGAHLIADALQDKFDTALVVSADTDLAAVVRLSRGLISDDKRVCTVAPPGRFSRGRELGHLFSITKGKIRKSRLPNEIQVNGKIITVPEVYSE